MEASLLQQYQIQQQDPSCVNRCTLQCVADQIGQCQKYCQQSCGPATSQQSQYYGTSAWKNGPVYLMPGATTWKNGPLYLMPGGTSYNPRLQSGGITGSLSRRYQMIGRLNGVMSDNSMNAICVKVCMPSCKPQCIANPPVLPEPLPVVPQPMPVPVAPQPMPIPVAPQPMPIPVAPQPMPVPVLPQPIPVPVAPQPMPAPITQRPVVSQPRICTAVCMPTCSQQCISNQLQPSSVVPEPVVVAPEPVPVVPQPMPVPVIPQPMPRIVVPQPRICIAVCMPTCSEQCIISQINRQSYIH
ncbi:unnamed protein product [Anisakis simplex]|uniref:Proline-rich protein 36-like n=1 Tax=Anisakis simplex TaxID=6269 RepID=A0A0M3K4X2_ANISI|nr:unnamed protein product [Anisakis simplex]